MALLLLVVLAGCSKSVPLDPVQGEGDAVTLPNGVVAPSSGYGSESFYPLRIGNSWGYEGRSQGWEADTLGNVVATGYDFRITEDRALVGFTSHEGVTYVVEETGRVNYFSGPPGDLFRYWYRWRQDRTGLYGLDTLLNTPPAFLAGAARRAPVGGGGSDMAVGAATARLAGLRGSRAAAFADRMRRTREALRGVAERSDRGPTNGVGEVIRLRYPLRPGETWTIRSDLPWQATVDRFEVVDTPAGRFQAARIEIVRFGQPAREGEWSRVWYSRSGFLGYSFRVISMPGGGGPSPSTFVGTESLLLSRIDLKK